MQYIVVDVEATCWASTRRPKRQEIIEIGAVRLAHDLTIRDEFASFVRPVACRELSRFCTELTSISQADVDAADFFPQVFDRFLDWIGHDPYRLCSWGLFDISQFQADCARYGMNCPARFESAHINVKKEYAGWRDVRRCGMAKALAHEGLSLDGTHHRGIDDARNIARIAQRMLPHLPSGRSPDGNSP